MSRFDFEEQRTGSLVEFATFRVTPHPVHGGTAKTELANKPGALAELAGKLAKKGINIDCAYATMPKGAKKAVVVLGTSKAGETSWA